jgi:hypothetical protein
VGTVQGKFGGRRARGAPEAADVPGSCRSGARAAAPDVQPRAREARRRVAGVRHDAQREAEPVGVERKIVAVDRLRREDLLRDLLLDLARRARGAGSAAAMAVRTAAVRAAAAAAAPLLLLLLVGHGGTGRLARRVGRVARTELGSPARGRRRAARCAGAARCGTRARGGCRRGWARKRAAPLWRDFRRVASRYGGSRGWKGRCAAQRAAVPRSGVVWRGGEVCRVLTRAFAFGRDPLRGLWRRQPGGAVTVGVLQR